MQKQYATRDRPTRRLTLHFVQQTLFNETISGGITHPSWFFVAPFQYRFMRGEFEDALASAQSVKLPGLTWDPFIRAAALQRLDKTEEAAALVREAMESMDDFPSLARQHIGRYVFEDKLADPIYDALVDAELLRQA